MKNSLYLMVFALTMFLGMVSAEKRNHEFFGRNHVAVERFVQRDIPDDEDCGKGAFGGVVSSTSPPTSHL